MNALNDPLFLLFLGMSTFAVIYLIVIGYILRQDVSSRNARARRRA